MRVESANGVEVFTKGEKTSPKVSVCVVTYNQKKYIAQCLQSIVDQETDFYFEIIVADDGSTDGTQEIVRGFSEKYPKKFRLFFHKNNIGAYENYKFVHAQAVGEYIAHIDGDDYCLPGKLQMQSEILDHEANCNIVWHKMAIEDPSGTLRMGNHSFASEIKFYRKDILKFMSIGANSSKMYRKSMRYFIEPNFDILDYFANVEQVGNGYARLVDDRCYGVYRAGIGISASGIKTRQLLAECFYYFAKKYPQYRPAINSAALSYFLGDLKNRRKTWPMFMLSWLRTFHISSIINFIPNHRFSRQIGRL